MGNSNLSTYISKFFEELELTYEENKPVLFPLGIEENTMHLHYTRSRL